MKLTKICVSHCLAWSNAKPDPRKACGIYGGSLGIGVNLLLFIGKVLVGLLSGSISIVADGLNNLSDSIASILTVAGFYFAGRKPDQEHPFGHGRAEYLTALFIALAIMLMGAELAQVSISKLFQSETIPLSTVGMLVLLCSILAKLFLHCFYKDLGNQVDSTAFLAMAQDSISDVLATSVVLASSLASPYVPFPLDPWAGLFVSILILKAGFDAVKDTISPLLGQAMDPTLAQEISDLTIHHQDILGIHDLIYHDYGPGRAMMSFHAEVPAEGNFLALHELIDHIEKELREKFQIDTVIHMDPVITDGPVDLLRQQVQTLTKEIHPDLSIHDLRTTAGASPLSPVKILFDLVIPFDFPRKDQDVEEELRKKVQALAENHQVIIEIDHSYVKSQEESPKRPGSVKK